VAWRVLSQPAFRRYFAGSLVSNLGTWLQNTAQLLLAYKLSGSAFVVGVVTCAQFSGFLVLGPWAAVIASRLGGKRVLIGTQVLSAAVAGGMAWLESAHLMDEHWLVAGALVLGLAFTFALPVQTALIPQLVDEADTEAAMAMNSVSYNAGRALAPALCVLITLTIGFTWAFALNAVSFAVFAGVLVKVAGDRPAMVAKAARARDGLVVALQQPRLLLLLAMVAAVTLADDPILVLGPTLARHLVGTSSDWPGFFLSALGCGTILGSLRPMRDTARRTASDSSRRAATSLLLLAGAVLLFAMGFSPWVSLVAAVLAGVAALRTGAIAQAQLARQYPGQAASLMGLWAIAWAGTKPLASLLDGWLGSTYGIRWAAVALVAVAVAVALAELLLNQERRTEIKAKARESGNRLGERLADFRLRDVAVPFRGRAIAADAGAELSVLSGSCANCYPSSGSLFNGLKCICIDVTIRDDQEFLCDTPNVASKPILGGVMVKRHSRPSLHYRYEHYDPQVM
jgi:MFS family permease